MSDALRAELLDRARELGFARVGIARVTPLEREGAALRRWIADGHHGSMSWMEDTVEVRVDPASADLLEGAKSVLVMAAAYGRGSDETMGPAPGVVARYARGRDYHTVLGKRTRKLAKLVRARGHRARASVDTVPVLERAWAQRAGIGFVGKNACLIVPGLGSHVFLATVVTDAELEPDEPMSERCGSCRACLDACPTKAFVRERELDARRCISYLTIEHEGAILDELREPIGAHLFGCDDCQDVCPFNRAAVEIDPAFAPDPTRMSIEASELLSMDEARFFEWTNASAIKRASRAGIARNAAIVLGNAGDRRHLPVLREAAERHDEPSVREAARWAVAKIDR